MDKKYSMLSHLPEVIETEMSVNPSRIYGNSELSKIDGSVIYIASRELRCEDNFALFYARELANKNNIELNVILYKRIFDTENKNSFFEEQFKITQNDFEKNGISAYTVQNAEEINKLLEELNPSIIIKDFDPIEKSFKLYKSDNICEVDGHNIVPLKKASDHQEYNAATFRRKIYAYIGDFLTEFPRIETSTNEKKDIVLDFINNRLQYYAEFKNNPLKKAVSDFSKYLNWGFISPQRVAIEVYRSDETPENKEAFLEELIVRGELSDNFCLYCKNFKSLDCISQWAKDSLNEHTTDIRTANYTIEELENALTYDTLWNASQIQLLREGKIHGYMRMYWAKKIAEWSLSPQEALHKAIHINDKYAFDAPSPNGYTAILWSIGGLHDRAFADRLVTGKIRTMTYNGAKNKFDVNQYTELYKK